MFDCSEDGVFQYLINGPIWYERQRTLVAFAVINHNKHMSYSVFVNHFHGFFY